MHKIQKKVIGGYKDIENDFCSPNDFREYILGRILEML
jgi:hypothetical protein